MCYDRIGTLEELRCERRRVDAELRRMGHRLAEDRKEIAGLLGISEKTSSSQLFRAKALLARRIKEYLKNE